MLKLSSNSTRIQLMLYSKSGKLFQVLTSCFRKRVNGAVPSSFSTFRGCTLSFQRINSVNNNTKAFYDLCHFQSPPIYSEVTAKSIRATKRTLNFRDIQRRRFGVISEKNSKKVAVGSTRS